MQKSSWAQQHRELHLQAEALVKKEKETASPQQAKEAKEAREEWDRALREEARRYSKTELAEIFDAPSETSIQRRGEEIDKEIADSGILHRLREEAALDQLRLQEEKATLEAAHEAATSSKRQKPDDLPEDLQTPPFERP